MLLDIHQNICYNPLYFCLPDSMAKQRNHARISKVHGSQDQRRPNTLRETRPLREVRPKGPFMESWNQKLAIFVSMNVTVVILSIVYFFYQHYIENVIITPLNQPKMVIKSGLDVPSMYWGSYMPGSYFGLRTRSPETLSAGMMWFSQKVIHNKIDIRHWCEQWNGVKHFTWVQHDGENFGVQQIDDKEVFIVTSFIKQVGGKHGGDWTANILFKPKIGPVSIKNHISFPLFFFFNLRSGILIKYSIMQSA